MATLKRTFPVTGMTCASCAVSVESMLRSVDGVASVNVNLADRSVRVEYEETGTSPEKMGNAIRSIGYDLITDSSRKGRTGTGDPAALREKQEQLRQIHYRKLRQRAIGSSLLAIPVFIIGMFFMHAPYAAWISMILTIPVLTLFGSPFFVGAWKQIRHGRANMDTLVALSTGAAFLFSAFNTIFPAYWHHRGLHPDVYFEAASVIIAFISIGKWLEERATVRTGAALKKLISLQPVTVRVVRGIKEREITLDAVLPGDCVLVRPGERIPVDGIVTDGSSYVDESMISGEAVPASKQSGAKVFAGTLNQQGSFRFMAEKIGKDTLLAQIIQRVQEAQGSKAPVQKRVDTIAGIFVPAVIGIALVSFLVWLLTGGDNAFSHAVLAAVTVLVIACPCALGLATPTAIMAGIGKGAENNILVKDAESLERAAEIDAIVFDKTGTLTEGKPVLADIRWLENSALTSLLYELEKRSEHPLAAAVVQGLTATGIQDPSPVIQSPSQIIQDFINTPGRGIQARIGNKTYFAGNRHLIDENHIALDASLAAQAAAWQSAAQTVLYFADEQQVVAVLGVTDQIKKSAANTIRQLKDKGIDIYMLTGDNTKTAAAVAGQLDISAYRAELLPADKANFIKSLQDTGRKVAMIGDGINDAPALAQADCSIAMSKGSDIAIDTAAITLLGSDPATILHLLTLSRKTVRTIRQNLFWAFVYNLIGIPLAAGLLYPVNGFLLNPMIAGAAMALSSVSVVTNSLRLQKARLDR